VSWLFTILGGVSKLAGIVASWFSARQQKQHDEQVMRAQQNEDALKGKTDALAQVDRVATAIDAPDPGVQYDPENRSR
jgi:hypothetical protein